MPKSDREMFFTSLKFFRGIMCSNKYSIKQKDDAFYGLCQDYFRLDIKKEDWSHFISIANEWGRRKAYELIYSKEDSDDEK